MDKWTISSRTYALPIGGGAVHAYIAVKDDTGQVIAEYHGFQVDPETGNTAGNDSSSYFPGSNFRLEARQYPEEYWQSRTDLRVHDEEVFRGSPEQVAQIRTELDQAVEDINDRELRYQAFKLFSDSQNSNSVYRTLMEVAGSRAEEIGADPIAIPGRLMRNDIVFDSQSRSSWAPGIETHLLPKGTSTSPKKQPPPLFRNKS